MEEKLLRDLKIDLEEDCPEDAILLLSVQRAIRSFREKETILIVFQKKKY